MAIVNKSVAALQTELAAAVRRRDEIQADLDRELSSRIADLANGVAVTGGANDDASYAKNENESTSSPKRSMRPMVGHTTLIPWSTMEDEYRRMK